MQISTETIWFYALVAVAVVVRFLHSEQRLEIRYGLLAALSAVVCAFVLTEPVLSFIGRWSSDPDVFRDAVVVLLALTGHDIVVGVLSGARDPKVLARFIRSVLFRGK